MPYGIGYDAAMRTGGGRRGGARGSLLDIPGQLLEAPAGIADRVAAVRSDNRAPGLRGALSAIAEPQPILQQDAFDAARSQDPQMFSAVEQALAAGDTGSARKAVMLSVAPIVAGGGTVPQHAAMLFQALNELDQQGYNPTAPDAPEQAAGLGMRMGEKGSTVGKALSDIMGRRSEAQRRIDQTGMEQARQPALIDRDKAAAQASRASAGSSSAMAELYRERAVTEEESRDPTIAKLTAAGAQAEAAADMALQKAASWQEEFDTTLAEIRARIDKAKADAENVRGITLERAGTFDANLAEIQARTDKAKADAENVRGITLERAGTFDANLARIRAGTRQTAAETRNTLGQARERARLEPARKAEIERRGQGGAGDALWEQLPDGPGMGAPTPAPTLIPQEQLTQTFPELFEMARTSQLSVKVAREYLRRRGVEDRASQDAILMSLDAYTGGGS